MEFLRDNAWFVGLLAALALLWWLGGSIAPFVIGGLAAYLLDPAVVWFERRGWGRTKGALLLVVLTFGVIATALALLAPVLVGEANELIKRAPELLRKAYERLWVFAAPVAEPFGLEADSLSGDLVGKAAEQATQTVSKLGTGLLHAVDILFLAFLTPFVAFWLLRDWPRVIEGTRDLVPCRSQPTVDRLAAKLDRRLSGWIRGQVLVCLFQGGWHSLGLWAIGLDAWLLVGVATGVANFVPVIGNWTMFLVAFSMAVIQFDSLLPILGVVALYAVSQVLEDTVLYPKLVGDRIDLHPLWVIFALLVSAALFGLPGALLAMPLACFADVIAEWLVGRYRASSFYRRPA